MPWRWRNLEKADQDPFREAVARYLASGLATVLLISLLGVYLVGRLGNDEAIRDAKDLTRATAERTIEPALTDDLLRGDPDALARFDGVVRGRVLRDSPVVRVKLWDRTGRIVYSDEPGLIGARYPLRRRGARGLPGP